ncbi:hypothetical protein [Phenylobacterium sp.]|uniref:hypothetical protein n=1 Tax=Phenylobacterium sp. TaxID=1871053 RepID=UPI0025DCDCB4|nr:hypothetical protein [Phenylobacterium sp.]
MSARLAAAGLALACIGGAAAAAAPPPATLPQVVAWAQAHLRGVDDWPLLGFNPQGMTLASPAGAALQADGMVEGDIRQEFFEPIELDGRILRSTSGRWRVDCARQRYAIVWLKLYARNDQREPLGERAPAAPTWTPRDSFSGDIVDALCEAVRNGARLEPAPARR